MTCAECGEIEILIAHSKLQFCSYECVVKNEGKDWTEIRRCPTHTTLYKGKCEKCENTVQTERKAHD